MLVCGWATISMDIKSELCDLLPFGLPLLPVETDHGTHLEEMQI